MAVMPRVEVEAMLQKNKEKASASTISLDLSLLIQLRLQGNLIQLDALSSHLEVRLTEGEHERTWACFLCSIGACCNDQNLCLREFSNSLIDHAYTFYEFEARICPRLGAPILLIPYKIFLRWGKVYADRVREDLPISRRRTRCLC